VSTHINVNPDHYKGAGRERQGETIVQTAERQVFQQQHALNERWQAKEHKRETDRATSTSRKVGGADGKKPKASVKKKGRL
jgi:hypothetical protein